MDDWINEITVEGVNNADGECGVVRWRGGLVGEVLRRGGDGDEAAVVREAHGGPLGWDGGARLASDAEREERSLLERTNVEQFNELRVHRHCKLPIKFTHNTAAACIKM